MGSIFWKPVINVNVTEESFSSVKGELSDIKRELQITRKGHEEWTWGEEILDADLEVVDLEEVEL